MYFRCQSSLFLFPWKSPKKKTQGQITLCEYVWNCTCAKTILQTTSSSVQGPVSVNVSADSRSGRLELVFLVFGL